jgi:hypothetical protein
MKQNKIELDTDYIGGQGPLTKEEEKIISDFIRANKIRRQKFISRKRKTVKKERAA